MYGFLALHWRQRIFNRPEWMLWSGARPWSSASGVGARSGCHVGGSWSEQCAARGAAPGRAKQSAISSYALGETLEQRNQKFFCVVIWAYVYVRLFYHWSEECVARVVIWACELRWWCASLILSGAQWLTVTVTSESCLLPWCRLPMHPGKPMHLRPSHLGPWTRDLEKLPRPRIVNTHWEG
jgi:hypothetical protein